MNYRTTIIGTLLALMLLAGMTQAADTPKQPKPTQTVAEQDVNAAWERRIPEYTSDGLPLGEVVKYLQDHYPEINFHLKAQTRTEGAEQIDLSSISVHIRRLRSVTLAEFLQVLQNATEFPMQIIGKPGDRLVVFHTAPAPGRTKTPSPVETRVFSIAKLLDGRSEKEQDAALNSLYEVIHLSGDMLSKASSAQRTQPQIQIHRGTKLLIAVGRPQELDVIGQVVRELQGSSDSAKVPEKPERKPDEPRKF